MTTLFVWTLIIAAAAAMLIAISAITGENRRLRRRWIIRELREGDFFASHFIKLGLLSRWTAYTTLAGMEEHGEIEGYQVDSGDGLPSRRCYRLPRMSKIDEQH